MKTAAWLRVRDRGAFIRLSGVLFLVYAATGLWAPLMSVYTRDLGATTAEIGLVLAVAQAVGLLSQYQWGRLSDWLGRRAPLVVLGAGGLCLAFLGSAAADRAGWLFLTRGLEGAAMGAYTTGSLALIGDLLEDQAGRGRLMGTYRMFGSLSFAMTALLGGALADWVGLRAPLLVAAVCYGLGCALSFGIREPLAFRGPVPAIPADPGAALPLDPLRRRALWSFLALLFVWMLASGAVVALWPVSMADQGFSRTATSGLWALAALVEVPCMILAGQLSDRFGRKQVLLFGITSMAAVFLAYTLTASFGWLAAAQVLRGIAFASFEAPALLSITELGLRQQRGRLAGLYYSASGGGSIAGAALGGIAAQQVGMARMFQGVALLMLATTAVVGVVMPRLRAVAAETPTPQQSRV